MTTTMAPNETLDRRLAARVGTIVIARHGQPHADRSVVIDRAGYREWWAGYDRAGLHPDERPPEKLVKLAERSDIIYASTLQRAIHTAQMVAGGREIITDPVFIEAPLPPPGVWGKRRPGAWGVWARRVATWHARRRRELAAGGGPRRSRGGHPDGAGPARAKRAALRPRLVQPHDAPGPASPGLARSGGRWRLYWSYRRYEKVK